MLDRKKISLEQISGQEFETYRYVPRKVRILLKRGNWAFAKITAPLEYAGFEELLEDIAQAKFVKDVGVLAYKKEQGRIGRFYIVKRRDLDETTIQQMSERANEQGYLDVYMWSETTHVKGFANYLRFHRLDDGKVASAYLQTHGDERELYTWNGSDRNYIRIYGALPICRS